MVQRAKCIINDEKMIPSSPTIKSSPCSNHLSSVLFMQKWFSLLAPVPFIPVLFSLHFCESGDGALKCKDFLFSGKHGETFCCALVTKNKTITQHQLNHHQIEKKVFLQKCMPKKVTANSSSSGKSERGWHPPPKPDRQGYSHLDTETM